MAAIFFIHAVADRKLTHFYDQWFFSRTKARRGNDHPESASFGANFSHPEQLSLINGKIEHEDEQLCQPGFGKAA